MGTRRAPSSVRIRIGAIKTIENRAHLAQQCVVVRLKRTRAHVGEFCAVEVKTDSAFRAVLRSFEPEKLCLRVDESLNEPGGAHSINPQPLSRRPRSPPIVLTIKTHDLSLRSVRLLGRELRGQRRLGVDERFVELSARFAGEEVDGGERGRFAPQRCKAAAGIKFLELSRLAQEGLQRRGDRLVLRRAVE
jgi:hypothetical protein